MAVALVMDFPGGTRDQYDQVVQRMELGGRMPAGGIFHAAGPYGDGWRVVDVWEDLIVFERFREEKIMPLTAEAGLAPPSVLAVEIAMFREGSGETPSLLQMVILPGLDRATFMEMDAKIVPPGTTPEGLTFHVNGPVDRGWCVIDAWTTKEARDRFMQERIIPGTQDAPLTGPPDVQDLMVERTLAPATAAARA